MRNVGDGQAMAWDKLPRYSQRGTKLEAGVLPRRFENTGQGEQIAMARKREKRSRLTLALGGGVVKSLDELFCADDLAIERSGDQCVLLDRALLVARDCDIVDLQGTSERAFIVGLGFREISESAQFVALGGDYVALGENDVVNGGSAKLIFFLLRFE